jgi:hypothetical protein
MLVVLAQPAQAVWRAAAAARAVDRHVLVDGFRAAMGWPFCHFWRDLAARYPEAKVILTVRDADAWYDSIAQTIGRLADAANDPPDPHARAVLAMGRLIVMGRAFARRLADPAHTKAVFGRHVETETATVPRE